MTATLARTHPAADGGGCSPFPVFSNADLMNSGSVILGRSIAPSYSNGGCPVY